MEYIIDFGIVEGKEEKNPPKSHLAATKEIASPCRRMQHKISKNEKK